MEMVNATMSLPAAVSVFAISPTLETTAKHVRVVITTMAVCAPSALAAAPTEAARMVMAMVRVSVMLVGLVPPVIAVLPASLAASVALVLPVPMVLVTRA